MKEGLDTVGLEYATAVTEEACAQSGEGTLAEDAGCEGARVAFY